VFGGLEEVGGVSLRKWICCFVMFIFVCYFPRFENMCSEEGGE